jgi:hypothetical protein
LYKIYQYTANFIEKEELDAAKELSEQEILEASLAQ